MTSGRVSALFGKHAVPFSTVEHRNFTFSPSLSHNIQSELISESGQSGKELDIVAPIF